MSRYLCDLKNLFVELKGRYGEDDDAVQQVRHELEAVEALESRHQDLPALARNRLSGRAMRHSWEAPASASNPPRGASSPATPT